MGAKGRPSKAELRQLQKEDRSQRRQKKQMEAAMHQLRQSLKPQPWWGA